MSLLCGGGCYGLSQQGRLLFDEFPDATADDLFVATIVGRHRVTIVDTDPLIVNVPRTANALFAVLRRVYQGNGEMHALLAEDYPSESASTFREVLATANNPKRGVDAAVYVAFVVAARIATRLSKSTEWHRDDTSRSGDQ